MADEDAKESSTTKPAHSSRPQSARAKKKQDLKNLDLIMSGLKTDKEKQLARMLQAQIKKTNEREGEMRKLSVEMRQANAKIAELEKTAKQARNAVYKEQKLRTTAITEQQQVLFQFVLIRFVCDYVYSLSRFLSITTSYLFIAYSLHSVHCDSACSVPKI